MGIYRSANSENGLTKLVVWIFGGQSTVPSSLLYRQAELDRRCSSIYRQYVDLKPWKCIYFSVFMHTCPAPQKYVAIVFKSIRMTELFSCGAEYSERSFEIIQKWTLPGKFHEICA